MLEIAWKDCLKGSVRSFFCATATFPPSGNNYYYYERGKIRRREL